MSSTSSGSRDHTELVAALIKASGELYGEEQLGDSLNQNKELAQQYSQERDKSTRVSKNSRRASRSGSKNPRESSSSRKPRSSSRNERESVSGARRESTTRRHEKRNIAHASSSSLPPLPTASRLGLYDGTEDEYLDTLQLRAVNVGSMMSMGPMMEIETIENRENRKTRRKKEKREHKKRESHTSKVSIPHQNIPDMIEICHPETSLAILFLIHIEETGYIEKDDIVRDRRSNRRRVSTGSLTDHHTITDSYHSTKYDTELANMATSTKDRNGRMGEIQESYYQGMLLFNNDKLTQIL
jgi:hypothetical protein